MAWAASFSGNRHVKPSPVVSEIQSGPPICQAVNDGGQMYQEAPWFGSTLAFSLKVPALSDPMGQFAGALTIAGTKGKHHMCFGQDKLSECQLSQSADEMFAIDLISSASDPYALYINGQQHSKQGKLAPGTYADHHFIEWSYIEFKDKQFSAFSSFSQYAAHDSYIITIIEGNHPGVLSLRVEQNQGPTQVCLAPGLGFKNVPPPEQRQTE